MATRVSRHCVQRTSYWRRPQSTTIAFYGTWEFWVAFLTATAIAFQAFIAYKQLAVSRTLAKLATPSFKVHFNGVQNQPTDPKHDMLVFAFTVVNTSAHEARMTNWGLEVLHAGAWKHRGTFRYFPIDQAEDYSKGKPPSNTFSNNEREGFARVPAHDARQYVGFLPGNYGWHTWDAAKLFVEPVGGERTMHYIENWPDQYFLPSR